MRITTISSKRQVTLSKSLLEKYNIYPLSRISIEENDKGLTLRPFKKSVIEATLRACLKTWFFCHFDRTSPAESAGGGSGEITFLL